MAMKLKISSFANLGDHQRERLILNVLSDEDVGDYLVMCSSVLSDGRATAGNKVAYWFPDKMVKGGDLVVLYSKGGTNSEKKLEKGSTAHFFYWNQTAPIWAGGGVGAVLLYGPDFEFMKAPP